jgi:outer membrane immunogenic protein
MTLWRSSLLALTMSANLVGAATLAAADGLPDRGGGGWPNIPWSWTGLYGGVHLGGADAGGNDDGFIGGFQLGKNWQSGHVVYGVEGDISFSDTDNIDWFGTVRGRLGYLLTPSIMAYGTAGIGLIEFADDNGNGRDNGSDADFVLGVGLEGKLTDTTSWGVEYLDFSDSETDVFRARMNFRF